MRLEWQYSFTSKSLKIDKVIKYSIDLHKGSPESSDIIEGIIEIRPNANKEHSSITSGTIGVSIPFDIEQGTPIAHRIAYDFGQRMAFEYGDFQISWAILSCERIPETEKEKDEIGDLTHNILRISLITVPEKQQFNPSELNGSGLPRYNQVLLKLFNDAELKTDIIDKYLTRFKILETEFIDNNARIPTKKQLKSSATLKQVFYSIATSSSSNQSAFEELIDRFVDSRGKCAHLKKLHFRNTFTQAQEDSRKPYNYLLGPATVIHTILRLLDIMDFKKLELKIERLLGVSKPIKARELATILTDEFGLHIDRSDVNSVLYAMERKHIARKNKKHQWSLLNAPEPEDIEVEDATEPNIIFTPEQQSIININPNDHLLIRGQAGSGKTTVLAARAGHILSAMNHGSLLFLTYNTALCAYVKKAFAKSGMTGNIDVRTFHDWAKSTSELLGYEFGGWVTTKDRTSKLREFIGQAEKENGKHRLYELSSNPGLEKWWNEEIAWLFGQYITRLDEYLTGTPAAWR